MNNTWHDNEPFYEDSRSLNLSHYVMAERCIQAEYASIQDEMSNGMVSDTLIYILEGGFRGFHNLTPKELVDEYVACEDRWYRLYETNSLPWDVFEDDPIVALEEDENGEVAHA